MKKNCGTCKWFECFYTVTLKPVEVGKCENPKFGEVSVVRTSDECSDWEKQNG